MKDGTALALLLKVLLVALLRRFQPKAVASFELLSLAVPLPDLLAHWMVGPRLLFRQLLHRSLFSVSSASVRLYTPLIMFCTSFVDEVHGLS